MGGPRYRYVYNVDYGRILDTLSGHDDAVAAIRLGESLLVTASWDSTIKVWDCPAAVGDSRRSSQKYEFGDHESEVKAIDLSPDRKRIVSGSKDGPHGTHACWRAISFTRRGRGPHTARPNLARASARRAGSVMLWSIGTSAPALSLGQHTDAVNAVAFAPNGQTVISAGADGFIKVFDVAGLERYVINLSETPRYATAWRTLSRPAPMALTLGRGRGALCERWVCARQVSSHGRTDTDGRLRQRRGPPRRAGERQ